MKVKPLAWLVVLFVLLIAGPPFAMAEIYKWTDKDGVVHYGDQSNAEPKSAKPFHPVMTSKHLGDEASAEGGDQADDGKMKAEAERKDRAEAGDRQAREREDKQKCADARKRIDLLEKQVPVYIDEQGNYRPRWSGDAYAGERRYIDDAERQVEIGRMRTQIEEHCAP